MPRWDQGDHSALVPGAGSAKNPGEIGSEEMCGLIVALG